MKKPREYKWRSAYTKGKARGSIRITNYHPRAYNNMITSDWRREWGENEEIVIDR